MTSCMASSDLSEFGHTGTVNDVTYVDGPQGDTLAATRFIGSTSSNMVINNSPKLDTQYSITILVHLNVEGVGTVLNFGTDRGLGLSIITTNENFKIVFHPRTRDEGLGLVQADTNIPTNKWVYVAAVYDYVTGVGTLYLDGNAGATFQLDAQTAIHTQQDIYVGSLASESAYTGSVACLRIYNRALPRSEIRSVKECPFGE